MSTKSFEDVPLDQPVIEQPVSRPITRIRYSDKPYQIRYEGDPSDSEDEDDNVIRRAVPRPPPEPMSAAALANMFFGIVSNPTPVIPVEPVTETRSLLEIRMAEQAERLAEESRYQAEREERERATIKAASNTSVVKKAASVGNSFMSYVRRETSLLDEPTAPEVKTFKRIHNGEWVPVKDPKLLCVGIDVSYDTFVKIASKLRGKVEGLHFMSEFDYMTVESHGFDVFPKFCELFGDLNVIVRGRNVPEYCALVGMCSIGGEKTAKEHFVMNRPEQAINYLKSKPELRTRVPL